MENHLSKEQIDKLKGKDKSKDRSKAYQKRMEIIKK